MRMYRISWLDPFDFMKRERFFYRKADALRFLQKIRTDRPYPVRVWTVRKLTDGEWTPIQF